MANCSVFGCKSKKSWTKTSFHRFPADRKTCDLWKTRCGNRSILNHDLQTLAKNNLVCGLHFQEDELIKTGRGISLRKGRHSAPSKLLPAPLSTQNLQTHQTPVVANHANPKNFSTTRSSTKLISLLLANCKPQEITNNTTAAERNPVLDVVSAVSAKNSFTTFKKCLTENEITESSDHTNIIDSKNCNALDYVGNITEYDKEEWELSDEVDVIQEPQETFANDRLPFDASSASNSIDLNIAEALKHNEDGDMQQPVDMNACVTRRQGSRGSNADVHCQLCRLCALESEDVTPIFSKLGLAKQLASKINTSLPIKVLEGDRLPLQVCLRCELWLESVSELRDSCLAAHSKLQLMFPQEDCHQDAASAVDRDAACLLDDLPTTESAAAASCSQPVSTGPLLLSAQSLIFCEPHELPEKSVVCQVLRLPPPLRCDDCGVALPDLHAFCLHQRSLHHRSAVSCSACCVVFSSATQLRDHREELHVSRPKPPAQLAVRTTSVAQHLNTKPLGNCSGNCKSNDKVSTLNSSKTTFSSVGTLLNSVNNPLEPLGPVIIPPICPAAPLNYIMTPAINPLKAVKEPKVIKKRICKKRCKTEYKCKHCDNVFVLSDRDGYVNHRSEHRALEKAEKLKTSNIRCEYCDLFFLTDRSKLFHMSSKHAAYKPFMCEHCGKKYRNKTDLNVHVISIHDVKEKEFLCTECGKSFFSKRRLTRHLWTHTPETAECSVCSKKMNPRKLLIHMTHHAAPQFSCTTCGKRFYRNCSLTTHMRSHSNMKLSCDICGTTFKHTRYLLTHTNNVHVDHQTKLFICPVKKCTHRFIHCEDVVKHCDSHLPHEFSKNKSRQSRKSINDNNICAMLCSFCTKTFRSTLGYQQHMKSHTNEPGREELTLTCNICFSVFNDNKLFRNHLKTHPEALAYGCDYCEKGFINSILKYSHMLYFHGDRRFECGICLKTYQSKNDLHDHILNHREVHGGVKRFACHQCDKAFYTRRYLLNHSDVHSGIKRFSCHICSRAFRQNSDLKMHVYRHTGEKIFSCDSCDFSTNRRKDMTQHLAVKH